MTATLPKPTTPEPIVSNAPIVAATAEQDEQVAEHYTEVRRQTLASMPIAASFCVLIAIRMSSCTADSAAQAETIAVRCAVWPLLLTIMVSGFANQRNGPLTSNAMANRSE